MARCVHRKSQFMACVIALLMILFSAWACVPASAAATHKAKPQAKHAPRAKAPAQRAKKAPVPVVPMAGGLAPSALCIEAATGLVIAESNADQPRPPASMIKMILMLLVSEGIRDGLWNLGTPITVTKHAESMGGTQVALKEGEVFPLDQLMQAISVHSANDAAMAVALGLWGSEEAYRKRMNERAAELGMASTNFFSVHGLPPSKGDEPDRTTARDMARLAQFCVLDPQVMKWVSQKELQFRPEEPVKYSTNKLLFNMNNCDGIKTGYTRSAGFCLTATALRDNIRLIAVVMGADGKRDRFIVTERILEDGFKEVCKKRVAKKGDPIGKGIPVANCETLHVRVTAADDLWVVLKKSDVDKILAVPRHPAFLRPPVAAGGAVGELEAQLDGKTLGAVPLIVSAELVESRDYWKMIQSVIARREPAQRSP